MTQTNNRASDAEKASRLCRYLSPALLARGELFKPSAKNARLKIKAGATNARRLRQVLGYQFRMRTSMPVPCKSRWKMLVSVPRS